MSDISTHETNTVTPTTPIPRDNTPAKILEGVESLCNTALYVLTKGMYPGADAHLVNQAKEFIKEIRADVNRKQKDLAVGKTVDLGEGI